MLRELIGTGGAIAERGVAASRLVEALVRVSRGDREARDYLTTEGLADAADAIQPGLGQAVAHVTRAVQEVRSRAATIGEWKPVEDATGDPVYPWYPFVRRLYRQPWGGHIFLGPPQSGKTTTACAMAARLAEHLGYDIYAMHMFASDLEQLPHYRRLTPDQLAAELHQVGEHLATGAPLPDARKVILIDEHAFSTMGRGRQEDEQRVLSYQALAACGHIDWHVIYIGQHARQIPEGLFGQAVTYLKQPFGEEKSTDRDNKLIRSLWEDAEVAFRGLRQSDWLSLDPDIHDIRSWTYVYAPQWCFRGIVPVRPLGGRVV